MTDLLDELWSKLPVKTGHYPTGQWLTATENYSPIVRRVIKGKVDVVTQLTSGDSAISQAEAGDFLGVRNAILPDDGLSLKWQTLEDTVVEEIPWVKVEPFLESVPGVHIYLQQEARERLYQLLVAIHPLFKNLPRPARRKIAEHAAVRLLRDGEVLIREEDKQTSFYMVIFGELVTCKGNLRQNIRKAGDVVGEMSVFGFRQWAEADIVSSGVSELLEFPAEAILDAARAHQEIRDWLVNLSQNRLEESIHEKLDVPD